MAPTEAKDEVDAIPDPPLVVELKKIDDEYLELQKKFEKECQVLAREFTEKQKPLLEQRTKVLTGDDKAEDKETGTPALKGFWKEAIGHHPAFEDSIEEYDGPVLDYLKDVVKEDLDKEDTDKGFRLKFVFVENPYFTNTVLDKEYHTDPPEPYSGDINIKEIKSCTIDWKHGKNVTVELVKKKVKGGGAKKAKANAKEKEEPRKSFFREFFRSLKNGGELPPDVDVQELTMQMGADEDELEEEQLVEALIDNDHDLGCALRDNIIPFAVRWYTGEAAPEEDDDDDDDDDEDDDDDDDDDDESESEEDEPPKGKKGKAKPTPAKGKPAADADGKKKEEECKQQ